jgi:hypothetical protein
LALSLFLFIFQLALATRSLEHLSQLLHSFPSKLFSVFIPDAEEKLRSRPEEELKPSCHP